MKQPTDPPKTSELGKSTPVFWKSIVLIIIFAFCIVTLFGGIVFLFIAGAEQMEFPPVARVTILIVISGLFAWLVKRLSDAVSEMSDYWFPNQSEEQD